MNKQTKLSDLEKHILAVRSIKGFPLSLPTITGVKQPMSGGELFKFFS